ncbi:GNAT family N-acetyltransferase [Acinetobacter baumannii]|uniref:GNAT family N-acetyltransferase n=1 Tax=Acinetobacter baumannii TaxID=470 RepID=UPI000810BA41|nr:GNAT family N-acetyltransferase [Acinetobacter baumannii]MDC5598866.1 GNAT family N-acetyltransferase [Acinetobacter baumannii]
MPNIIVKNDYCIRKAESKDIDQLCELRKILLSNSSGHYSSQNTKEEIEWLNAYKKWLKENISNTSFLILVDEDLDNKKVIGCAIAIIDNRLPINGCLNGKSGWIQTVVVDSNYRKKGIMRENMSVIESWFLENSVFKIYLQTTVMAENSYLNIGFNDTGEKYFYKSLSQL